MSLIRRYLTGFRGVDTEQPGLFEKDDGTSWYRKPDGSEVEIGGGGGSSSPINWCIVNVASQTLTADSSFYDILASDLTIFSQSGSDFSIGTDPTYGDGALVSAAGGVFSAAVFASASAIVAALDVGSDATRWLTLGLSMGTIDGVDSTFTTLGIDGSIPLRQPSGVPHGAAFTFAGVPGYVNPGTSVFAGAFLNLAGASGTDSVTSPMRVWVWQSGNLPT